MNYKKIIIIVIIVIIGLMQLIRIDKTNPEINQENDYLTYTQAPPEISAILKESCYDCHSYTTTYPWYSNLAPISWILKNHIDEALNDLNFSQWGDLSTENKIVIKQKCIEVIVNQEMPLKSYTLIHLNAKLTKEEQTVLEIWFNKPENN